MSKRIMLSTPHMSDKGFELEPVDPDPGGFGRDLNGPEACVMTGLLVLFARIAKAHNEPLHRITEQHQNIGDRETSSYVR